ncbi:YrhK family protein [Shimia thalassica]|uniref:YrhK family protein n=1 Tax=Shimia thalassica TaxID=1715693 RepID=UPI0026E37054|nr:YrhK family protein [Shimia thalassica]MDO6523210.1 YrhK family protein [Shimia thalassica]
MFKPHLHTATPRHAEVYGFYEKVYTVIDLCAGLTFLVGSILFLWESTTHFATWLFIIGSAMFAARPLSRFLREFHLGHLPLPEDDPKT